MAGSGQTVAPSREMWARDPRAASITDSYEKRSHSQAQHRRHSSSGRSDSNSGQQRPPVRTNIPRNSQDDLSLVNISNGSEVRIPMQDSPMVTPPHGAGMYPPRNRYNVRLPPLSKRQY